jgi:hypothetical protein
MYPFERAEPWIPGQTADEDAELDAADDFYDQRYDRELNGGRKFEPIRN